MNKNIRKMVMAICVSTMMLVFVGCGSEAGEAGVSSGSNNDTSYEELQKQYEEVVDYALFLEKEVVRLDGEVRTLVEQNDILQKKLSEQ